MAEKTSFGYETISKDEKEKRVGHVFTSVANRYDIMNDAMSLGMHRLWKRSMIDSLNLKPGESLLDVAGGTGDIATAALKAATDLDIDILDINPAMLEAGKKRAEDNGLNTDLNFRFICSNAEKLPFKDCQKDAYSIAFGIRNVTNIDQALKEAWRVLKPGGRFVCMEFSPFVLPILQKFYDQYSFHIIPKLGQFLAGDAPSYQYLVESIRRFPDRPIFLKMMEDAGFSLITDRSLSAGVVRIYKGWRI